MTGVVSVAMRFDGLIEGKHACDDGAVTALTNQLTQVFKLVGSLFGGANNQASARTAR